MNRFSLKIGYLDWFIVFLTGTILTLILTLLVYLISGYNLREGIKVGVIFSLCLSLLSFSLISINNSYLLPKIKNTYWWWILSAILSFLAGYFGFHLAFTFSTHLDLEIPQRVAAYKHLISLLVGILNYLIGLLIFFFVNMKGKKEELEKLIIEERLIALSNQLNTHFLMNVLNSIAELTRLDALKAEAAIIKLSKFFRKALSGAELIEISEELDNVKNYVDLENLRHKNKIWLRIYGNGEKLGGIKIPRFSIQLLVENAIKHGFQEEILNIFISLKKEDHFLEIRVSNDGKKMENFHWGRGLTNLAQRLKYLKRGTLMLGDREKNEFIIRVPL